MILYMYIASAGADHPFGQNFNYNRKASSLQPQILYTSFHDLINLSLLLKELIFYFYLPSLQLVLCSVAAVKRLPIHQL